MRLDSSNPYFYAKPPDFRLLGIEFVKTLECSTLPVRHPVVAEITKGNSFCRRSDSRNIDCCGLQRRSLIYRLAAGT